MYCQATATGIGCIAQFVRHDVEHSRINLQADHVESRSRFRCRRSMSSRRSSPFLDERCAKIDALIAKANEVIETMREYRSALITDAVTGKIDVRGAA